MCADPKVFYISFEGVEIAKLYLTEFAVVGAKTKKSARNCAHASHVAQRRYVIKKKGFEPLLTYRSPSGFGSKRKTVQYALLCGVPLRMVAGPVRLARQVRSASFDKFQGIASAAHHSPAATFQDGGWWGKTWEDNRPLSSWWHNRGDNDWRAGASGSSASGRPRPATKPKPRTHRCRRNAVEMEARHKISPNKKIEVETKG